MAAGRGQVVSHPDSIDPGRDVTATEGAVTTINGMGAASTGGSVATPLQETGAGDVSGATELKSATTGSGDSCTALTGGGADSSDVGGETSVTMRTVERGTDEGGAVEVPMAASREQVVGCAGSIDAGGDVTPTEGAMTIINGVDAASTGGSAVTPSRDTGAGDVGGATELKSAAIGSGDSYTVLTGSDADSSDVGGEMSLTVGTVEKPAITGFVLLLELLTFGAVQKWTTGIVLLLLPLLELLPLLLPLLFSAWVWAWFRRPSSFTPNERLARLDVAEADYPCSGGAGVPEGQQQQQGQGQQQGQEQQQEQQQQQEQEQEQGQQQQQGQEQQQEQQQGQEQQQQQQQGQQQGQGQGQEQQQEQQQEQGQEQQQEQQQGQEQQQQQGQEQQQQQQQEQEQEQEQQQQQGQQQEQQQRQVGAANVGDVRFSIGLAELPPPAEVDASLSACFEPSVSTASTGGGEMKPAKRKKTRRKPSAKAQARIEGREKKSAPSVDNTHTAAGRGARTSPSRDGADGESQMAAARPGGGCGSLGQAAQQQQQQQQQGLMASAGGQNQARAAKINTNKQRRSPDCGAYPGEGRQAHPDASGPTAAAAAAASPAPPSATNDDDVLEGGCCIDGQWFSAAQLHAEYHAVLGGLGKTTESTGGAGSVSPVPAEATAGGAGAAAAGGWTDTAAAVSGDRGAGVAAVALGGGYPQLDFSQATSFLTSVAPAVEGVISLGKFLLIEIRGDGNCFFTSSTIGVLLWAVEQPGSAAIRGVRDRFRDAIFPKSGGSAYMGLSEVHKGYVRDFEDFMAHLVAVKERDAGSAGPLAVEIARRLNGTPESGGETGGGGSQEGSVPLHSKIYRGMVIASRIAAIATPPHNTKKAEVLDNFRTVSMYTCEDFPALRPGENLGVHLGLISEDIDAKTGGVEAVAFDKSTRPHLDGISCTRHGGRGLCSGTGGGGSGSITASVAERIAVGRAGVIGGGGRSQDGTVVSGCFAGIISAGGGARHGQGSGLGQAPKNRYRRSAESSELLGGSTRRRRPRARPRCHGRQEADDDVQRNLLQRGRYRARIAAGVDAVQACHGEGSLLRRG
eukprot:g13270.t1